MSLKDTWEAVACTLPSELAYFTVALASGTVNAAFVGLKGDSLQVEHICILI